MLDEAKRYCRTVANGLPRNFEFDDLVQEYITACILDRGQDAAFYCYGREKDSLTDEEKAEVERLHKVGANAIKNYVMEIDKHNKNLDIYHSMEFVVDDEIDLDLNEEGRDAQLRLDQEKSAKVKAARHKRLSELNQKLERIHPDRAEVIRFLSTCDIDDEHGTVSSIMERFKCDFASARYMWYDGIESIRELDNPSKKKEMPMYGEADYVPDLRTPHKKWKRTRKQPESEVILGEEAA